MKFWDNSMIDSWRLAVEVEQLTWTEKVAVFRRELKNRGLAKRMINAMWQSTSWIGEGRILRRGLLLQGKPLLTAAKKSTRESSKDKKEVFTLPAVPMSVVSIEKKEKNLLCLPSPQKKTILGPDQEKYCRYRSTTGHDTEDCRNLKREIKWLI